MNRERWIKVMAVVVIALALVAGDLLAFYLGKVYTDSQQPSSISGLIVTFDADGCSIWVDR